MHTKTKENKTAANVSEDWTIELSIFYLP